VNELRRRGTPAAIALVALAASLAACAPDKEPAITLPPTGAAPDYQLGAAYEPPAGVAVVARDRTADPTPGVYSICYVDGAQRICPELLAEVPQVAG